MQTRYQLVQTYFINISTTNHRARAVRIHPSRAVFRKDEKFSESLYILGGNPKKIIIQRAQAKSERARYFSLHSHARDTNYALSSLSREADNHRRRQQKRMLYAYLCHFIFMSVVCFNEVEFC
jgi:predicted transcriptional regulator